VAVLVSAECCALRVFLVIIIIAAAAAADTTNRDDCSLIVSHVSNVGCSAREVGRHKFFKNDVFREVEKDRRVVCLSTRLV